jgi:hypothetical protein
MRRGPVAAAHHTTLQHARACALHVAQVLLPLACAGRHGLNVVPLASRHADRRNPGWVTASTRAVWPRPRHVQPEGYVRHNTGNLHRKDIFRCYL